MCAIYIHIFSEKVLVAVGERGRERLNISNILIKFWHAILAVYLRTHSILICPCVNINLNYYRTGTIVETHQTQCQKALFYQAIELGGVLEPAPNVRRLSQPCDGVCVCRWNNSCKITLKITKHVVYI